MAFLVVLVWIALAAVALAVVGFSQIFKLGEGVRLVWAAMICMGLIILLIAGVETALVDARKVAPTPEQEREAFINDAVEKAPWMSREDFN